MHRRMKMVIKMIIKKILLALVILASASSKITASAATEKASFSAIQYKIKEKLSEHYKTMLSEKISIISIVFKKYKSLFENEFKEESPRDNDILGIKILDLGGGTGFISSHFKKTTIVEPNKDTIAWGHAQGVYNSNNILFPSKLEALPSALFDNYFDIVYGGFFYESTMLDDKSSWDSHFKKLSEILKKSGYAYLYFAEDDYNSINSDNYLMECISLYFDPTIDIKKNCKGKKYTKMTLKPKSTYSILCSLKDKKSGKKIEEYIKYQDDKPLYKASPLVKNKKRRTLEPLAREPYLLRKKQLK